MQRFNNSPSLILLDTMVELDPKKRKANPSVKKGHVVFRGNAPVLTESGARELHRLARAKTDAHRQGRSLSVEEEVLLGELHTASSFTKKPRQAEPMKSASRGAKKIKPAGGPKRKPLHRAR